MLLIFPRQSNATLDAMLVTYPAASENTPWTSQWERAMYAYQESEVILFVLIPNSVSDHWLVRLLGLLYRRYQWQTGVQLPLGCS